MSKSHGSDSATPFHEFFGTLPAVLPVTGGGTVSGPGSASFAFDAIRNHTLDEIVVVTAQVYAGGASGPMMLVIDKEASRMAPSRTTDSSPRRAVSPHGRTRGARNWFDLGGSSCRFTPSFTWCRARATASLKRNID